MLDSSCYAPLFILCCCSFRFEEADFIKTCWVECRLLKPDGILIVQPWWINRGCRQREEEAKARTAQLTSQVKPGDTHNAFPTEPDWEAARAQIQTTFCLHFWNQQGDIRPKMTQKVQTELIAGGRKVTDLTQTKHSERCAKSILVLKSND